MMKKSEEFLLFRFFTLSLLPIFIKWVIDNFGEVVPVGNRVIG